MKIAVAAKSTNYFQNIKLQKKKKIETSDCIYCHITGEKKTGKNSLDPYDGKHTHTHTHTNSSLMLVIITDILSDVLPAVCVRLQKQ